MNFVSFLKMVAFFSFLIATLHVVVVLFLGAEGYRLFGAGEEMALMSEQGKLYPHFLTILISVVFTLFAFYALSGNQVIRKLTYLKVGLIIITAIYLIRGFVGIPVYFFGNENKNFIFWSSLISFIVGVSYLFGIKQNWMLLKKL